ncbi:MAG: DUF551 domain-containing protein [Nitrosomonadaceae bacterium]
MSEWIEVTDRLPKRGEWYLISAGPNRRRPMTTMAMLDSCTESGRAMWLSHNDLADDDEWENVTHWMPLPEPPCA